MGLEKGWGDSAGRVSEMIHLLLELLEAPDPSTLETFLGRIPMAFNVVILSPHGYFAQSNVLGLPDTGGQVLTLHYQSSSSRSIYSISFLNTIFMLYVDCLYFGPSSSFGE